MLLNIRFSAHARQQLIERGLAEQHVNETVLGPGQIHFEDDVFVFQKVLMVDTKQYLFRVVARKDGLDWFIITVYRTSKISKYWRETN